MKNVTCRVRRILLLLALVLLLGLPGGAKGQAPDLTSVNLSTIDRTYTYNLGATGMRGWIYTYASGYAQSTAGLTTVTPPWQILVTTVGAGTPASGILASNDVILGVSAGSGNLPVPLFSGDARKSFGLAIGAAEAGDGVMNLKRWRAADGTNDISIHLQVLGAYSATAPYDCPKSAIILSNACNIIGSKSFNLGNPGNQVLGLALLASGNTNFMPQIKTYAYSIAPANLALRFAPGQQTTTAGVWDWGYKGIFLAEYYLLTGDANVIHGINEYATALAQAQSRYGTMCHGGALLNDDGSFHGTIGPYGPVNQGGLTANMAIVMGKKCLVASGTAVDPEIDPAIDRAAKFFGFYVQKGNIPYGEHEPWYYHAGNGKESTTALLFDMMGDKPVETEYFTRMVTAGYNGRQYGHTGQGFSYLWGAMAANIGGTNAVASYLAQVRWHLDLQRRCDGSFVYDGGEQFGGSAVTDYWTVGGNNDYYGIDPTASYVLTYALPKQAIYLTGKNANPTNWLTTAEVTNAIWAGVFDQAVAGYNTNQLMSALGEYDPLVRTLAATQLGGMSTAAPLFPVLTNLVGSSTNPWLRQAACTTLGIMKNTNALPLLSHALYDSDIWVRAQAANALRSYAAAATPQVTNMLMAFTNNATNPDVIDWSDPVQIANGFLGFELFGDAVYGGNNIASTTKTAPTNLYYAALRAGLKQPDSKSRKGATTFSYNNLTLADVKAVVLDLIQAAATESQADTMWSMDPRANGISTLAKFYVAEAIPVALAMQDTPTGFGWNDNGFKVPALNALKAYGDSARWTLPTLNTCLLTWDPASTEYPALISTIASINAATNSPAGITNLFPVASPQIVVVTNPTPKTITLTGFSCRTNTIAYAIVTQPAHGTLTGTAPNLTYTAPTNYYGLDSFTFQVSDSLTNSAPGTVSIIIGVAGTGLTGAYYNNPDYTSLNFTRSDPQVLFDWGSGKPTNTMPANTFSVQWSGRLLVPESGNYLFSTLNSGGVNLWVNGVKEVDDAHPVRQWADGTAIALTAGQTCNLQMNFASYTGDSVAKLKWTGPSFAGSNGVPIAQQWLYGSTVVSNGPAPIANAQSVTTPEGTPAAITLTGGDAWFNPLTFINVTLPGHGTLAGTAPNLTYTPAASYYGPDSFTFQVNNGISNSSAGTVAITVTPVTHITLVNAAAGYAGPAASSAVLNATLSCDKVCSVKAYWNTTSGGTDAAAWTNSASVGSFTNVSSTSVNYTAAGLSTNTQYFFAFSATPTNGPTVWAGNELSFGPPSGNSILTFGLPNQPASINGASIAWTVLYSAVVTNLSPVFTVSQGATAVPASGVARNFSTPQTYTVTAANGAVQVYTVTVTQSPNAGYYWNTASSANWNVSGSWTNEVGVAAAPVTNGQGYYNLNFKKPGTYTATHNLGNGFLLNQLNFSNATVTLAGNSLTFTNWNSPYGGGSPQINQNGSTAVSIATPLIVSTAPTLVQNGSNVTYVTAPLTFGGTGSGQVTLSGMVGTGSLTDGGLLHAGPYILYLNTANNGFPGGLVVSNATLKASVGNNTAFGGQTGNWQSTKAKLSNATLQLSSGGWCSAGFDLQGTNTITATTSSYPFFLGGLTGSGLLYLTGNNQLAFNGNSSTYSGDVIINLASTITFGGSAALGSGGTVTMASPGGVNMGIESSNGAGLDNYINLATNLTFSWSYNNMTFTLNRDIYGPGSITKVFTTNDAGTHLQLRGTASTYSGGTIFKSGNLEVLGANSLGTGPLTMGGKAFAAHEVAFVPLSPMVLANNIILAGINEPSLTNLAAVTEFSVAQDLVLSGPIAGTGGLLKTGANKLTLSGVNAFSGPTIVSNGVLSLANALALGTGTSVNVSTGATVNLNYTGNLKITALSTNGVQLAPGVYGAAKLPTFLTGTGFLDTTGNSITNTPATGITSSSATLNATLVAAGTNYTVHAFWNTVNGGTNAALWVNSALAGRWTNVVSTNLTYASGGLTPGVLYYFTFRATNSGAILWATNVQSFTTLPLPGPVVDNANGATNLAVGVAQLRGTLANGPADVRLYWGTADGGTTPANWTNTVLLGSTPTGSFAANVSNLLYGLTCYYRSYASNQWGTAWAPATTNFTTLRPPSTLANSAATGITTTSAALNGVLACTGAVYQVSAFWNIVNGGTNAALWTNSASVGTWTNVAATNLSFTATGLAPNMPCFFTFRATNALDVLWATNVQSFTTIALPGVDNAAGATNLSAGVAQLRGTLANGPADVRLYWGTADGGTNQSAWANTNLLEGVASGSFSSNVSNLLYGLTYSYRSYASNQWGTAWAPATTNFTTLRPPSTLANAAATGITTNAAVLNATLACPGAAYQVSAFWNTVNGGTNATLWTNSAYLGAWTNVASTNLSYSLPGLAPRVAYYFAFRATNALDNLWATNVQSFTTLSLPGPVVDNAGGATNLVAGVAQLRGTLANGPADVRLCWGTADDGTNLAGWANATLLGSAVSGSFSSNISNLVYGLTYYYRAYASNQWGTAWAPAPASLTTLKPMGVAAGQIPFSSIVAVSASSETSGYEAVKAFNGAGLQGDGTHATSGEWVSSSGTVGNEWLKVRFDQTYNLDYLRVWAFNESPDMCVTNVSVYVITGDTDPGNNVHLDSLPFNSTGWTAVLPNQAFTPNPASGSGAETNTDPHLSLGGVSARQVALKINSVVNNSIGLAGFAEVQIYRLAPTPINLTNTAATAVTASTAGLNGALACAGAMYDVLACWGTANGGTNTALWANSAYVGAWTNAALTNLTYTATGLTPSTPYYFTLRATNAVDAMWAANVLTFTTAVSLLPPAPVLPPDGVTVTGGVPSFSFTAAAGCRYRLDYKNLLTDTAWSFGGWSTNSTGSDQPMTLSDSTATGQPQRYYRLEAAKP